MPLAGRNREGGTQMTSMKNMLQSHVRLHLPADIHTYTYMSKLTYVTVDTKVQSEITTTTTTTTTRKNLFTLSGAVCHRADPARSARVPTVA